MEDIAFRTMMGEFILYYRGKVVGSIYDDRLLVKPVKSAISYMPTAVCELTEEMTCRFELAKAFLDGYYCGEKIHITKRINIVQ